MRFKRSSGILLHPTSLPGPYGIGDLGPQARSWVDFLAESGTGLWQILPLGPTGFGDSPYQTFSSFAGNPLLISPDDLLQDNLIHPDDLKEPADFNKNMVEYGKVIYWKLDLLGRSFLRFQHTSGRIQKEAQDYYANNDWLDDYALFIALKEFHGGKPWSAWRPEYRDRHPRALKNFRGENQIAVERQKYFQYLFARQWKVLHGYAREREVKIIGDLPIFIAHDSADVWTNRSLFHLDEKGAATVVAGVPPDYFSATGQLWGNPLYRWEIHQERDYSWWLQRLRSTFDMVDILRLDHFRGFHNYWEIPAGEVTAINGRWVPGPGTDFLNQVKGKFGDMQIIAEDLGEIPPEVYQLRDQFNLPGMKILVFAFNSGESNSFLPHQHPENCVVYTGTHDNDTVQGWFNRAEKEEKQFALSYLQSSGEDIAWGLVRAAWGSSAVFALAPLQDLLGLDNSARMNFPGTSQGNWAWRFAGAEINKDLKDKLKDINEIYGRLA